MEPFATVADYERMYGAVADSGRLYECLMDATDLICSELDGHDISYTDPSESFTYRLMRVCRSVAHRAMGDGGDADIPFGAKQLTQTAESFSATVQLANPYMDLFLTEAERRALGIGAERACVTSPYG